MRGRGIEEMILIETGLLFNIPIHVTQFRCTQDNVYLPIAPQIAKTPKDERKRCRGDNFYRNRFVIQLSNPCYSILLHSGQ